MKALLLRFTKMSRIISLILAAAIIVVACTQEPDLDLDLEKKTPASFVFSGRSLAKDFEILELPRTKPLSKTNPFSFTGATIWKISAPESIKGAKWPNITYGDVPNGFSQTIPENGPPPKLSGDKLYVARITGGKDAQTALFFEIRNGRPVNVSDEVLGP